LTQPLYGRTLKKKEAKKTFINWSQPPGRDVCTSRAAPKKVFLLLFLQKKKNSSFLTPPP
jgi:hypothetical protein